LMFCAQMVGNPVIAPEPTAMPPLAAVAFRNLLRETPPISGLILLAMGALRLLKF
jgi:hypothetical protein